MNMIPTIQPAALSLHPFTAFEKGWMVLSAGDYKADDWNCMTVSWGFVGTMWNLPVAQTVVRPQRYTREFLDKYDTFTLCAFPDSCRKALQILGSKSGRDGDKVAESGLRPMASTVVAAPSFAEAELVIECRKIFRQPMTPEAMLDPRAVAAYPTRDYHIIYIGEVVAVRRT